MMWASPDRWTCPTCRITEVPDVPDDRLADAIRRAQLRHAKDHPAPFQPVTDKSRAVARRRAARSRS